MPVMMAFMVFVCLPSSASLARQRHPEIQVDPTKENNYDQKSLAESFVWVCVEKAKTAKIGFLLEDARQNNAELCTKISDWKEYQLSPFENTNLLKFDLLEHSKAVVEGGEIAVLLVVKGRNGDLDWISRPSDSSAVKGPRFYTTEDKVQLFHASNEVFEDAKIPSEIYSTDTRYIGVEASGDVTPGESATNPQDTDQSGENSFCQPSGI